MTGERTCDCCAQRDQHMYRLGCERCEARAYARAPLSVVAATINERGSAFAAMADEERERDALTGADA